MKVLRNIALLFLIFIVAIAGCIFYAFQIEPYRLKVHPYNINQQQEGTTGYKMVQISDLHIKQDFTDQNLKKVVDKINGQTPDITIMHNTTMTKTLLRSYKESKQIMLKLPFGEIGIMVAEQKMNINILWNPLDSSY